MTSAFCDWAVRLYGFGGVQAVCLSLQDDEDQCVPLLLWGLWLGGRASEEQADDAVAIARAYQDEIIAPLRGLRRKLKGPLGDVIDTDRLSLREDVKALELKGEFALMRALEALVPAKDAKGGSDPVGDLAALSRVWGARVPRKGLEALSAACDRFRAFDERQG